MSSPVAGAWVEGLFSMMQRIYATTESKLLVWVAQSRMSAIISTYMNLGECEESVSAVYRRPRPQG